MRLAHIAFKNLANRKNRTLIMILSIVIGVASSVFLYTVTKSMKKDVADKLDQFGSNILILPKAGESVSYGGVTIHTGQGQELDLSMIPLMKTIKNKETLAIISPKLLAEAKIHDKRALLVGVDFAQELQLKKWWQIQGLEAGQLPTKKEILVGSEAARIFGVSLNSTLPLKGEEFQVRGILEPTGSLENDQGIFMDLTTLQALDKKPTAISLIEAAALCYTCPIEEVTQQLSEKLPEAKVTALQANLQSRDDTVQFFNLFGTIISSLLLLASGIVIAMSLLTAVKERTGEIGVLRALGFGKKHILQVLLLEVITIGLIGGLVGFALGMGLAMKLGVQVIQMSVQVPFEPLLGIYSVGAALGLSLVASIYPILSATKLDPVEALRYF